MNKVIIRTARVISLALIFVVLISARGLAALPQASGPLSEQDLVKLLKMGASMGAITPIVEKFGVSFPADNQVLDRLKQAGAQPALLEVIRRKAPSTPALPSATAPPVPMPAQPDPAAVLEATRHLDLGQLKAKERDYDAALREFAEAEKNRPRWSTIYFQRGLVLADQDHFSEAAAEWKKYIAAAGPGANTELYARKVVEWEKEAPRRENARRLIERGREQLKNLDADAAAKSFQEAANLSYSLDNLLNLARAYLLLGDYALLARTAAEVLALDPQSAQGRLFRAAAELGRGDVEQSLGTIEDALILNPDLAYGYALLAAALQRKTETAGVLAVRPDPLKGSFHNRVGWSLWNGGSYNPALEEFHRATELEPKTALWFIDFAYALHYRGDDADAVVAAREAVRLNPTSASAHDALGLALEGKGSFEQAMQQYKEANRLSTPAQAAYLRHLNHLTAKKEPARTAERVP